MTPRRPERSISFDRIAHTYDETRGGLERGRTFASSLAPLLPGDGTVLEIGVGTGAVATGLREQGIDVVGVDLSLPMLTRARERLGRRVVQGDAHHLPVAPGSCAAALLVWVLQLVPDPVAVLGEAARALRPGAPLVAVTSIARYAPADEIDAIVFPAMEQLRSSVGPDEVIAAAARLGWSVLDRTETAPEHWLRSPNGEADRIEGRTYSSLWDVDEAAWTRVITPMVEALRSLPDPDRQRRRSSAHPIVVLGPA